MADSIFTIIGRTVKNLVDLKVDKAGSTMTGPLLLSRNAVESNEATTKAYVDQAIHDMDHDQYAKLAGANFTGDVTGTNLTLSGDLTVNGAVTTLDTTNSTIKDSLILLSKGASDNENATNDSGIMIERGSTESNATMFWDEGDEVFRFATTSSDATATDIGASSESAGLRIAGLNTFGDDLGRLEDFYGGLVKSYGNVVVSRSEYDAAAVDGRVRVEGLTSPLASTTIEMDYSNPSEVIFDIIKKPDEPLIGNLSFAFSADPGLQLLKNNDSTSTTPIPTQVTAFIYANQLDGFVYDEENSDAFPVGTDAALVDDGFYLYIEADTDGNYTGATYLILKTDPATPLANYSIAGLKVYDGSSGSFTDPADLSTTRVTSDLAVTYYGSLVNPFVYTIDDNSILAASDQSELVGFTDGTATVQLSSNQNSTSVNINASVSMHELSYEAYLFFTSGGTLTVGGNEVTFN